MAGDCGVVERLRGVRGYYIVLIRVGGVVEPLPGLRLHGGCYLYLGSAMGPGGLGARLRRHLCGRRRRLWWHVDRILSNPAATAVAAVVCPSARRGLEPLLAALLHGSRCAAPVGSRVGGSDDPYGFSHLLRCTGGCRGCALAALSGLPCLPGLVVVGSRGVQGGSV